MIKIKFLANGWSYPEMIDEKHTNKLLKAALPEFSSYIDQYGSAGHHHLIEILEEKILSATQDMLAGKDNDKASLERAHSILSLSKNVTIDENVASQIPHNLKIYPAPSQP